MRLGPQYVIVAFPGHTHLLFKSHLHGTNIAITLNIRIYSKNGDSGPKKFDLEF